MKFKFTEGAEIELGKVDTRIKIPSKYGAWDYKDKSICNPNGSANDPLKKINRYGSEINTAIFSSPDDLADATYGIYKRLEVDEECCNYTTNTHVHIAVPGLVESVKNLKRIAKYIRGQEDRIYTRVDVIPDPRFKEFANQAAFAGAWKRYKRRFRSHQYRVTYDRYQKMLKARTSEEFRDAHLVFSKAGKPQWHLLLRAGFNMASLWKHGTIEIRFFTTSYDTELMHNAYKFCALLVEDALYDQVGVDVILKEHKLEFQPYFDYNYRMDKIFQQTTFMKHTRSQIKETYERLIRKGRLTAEELGWEE